MYKFLLVAFIFVYAISPAAAQTAEPDDCAQEALENLITFASGSALEPIEILRRVRAQADEALELCDSVDEEAELIPTDDTHVISEIACAVAFDISRGNPGFRFTIAGEAQDDVFVDVYLPDEDEPVEVAGQLDKTFIDTGDVYIHQYYARSSWPLGAYELLIERDDKRALLAFDMERAGDYNVFIYCQ